MLAAHRQKGSRPIVDVEQFVVHDINNLFAVIASGLRLLECHDDAGYRRAIVSKMEEAITRGALLSRQLLEKARLRDHIEARRFPAIRLERARWNYRQSGVVHACSSWLGQGGALTGIEFSAATSFRSSIGVALLWGRSTTGAFDEAPVASAYRRPPVGQRYRQTSPSLDFTYRYAPILTGGGWRLAAKPSASHW